MQIPNLPTKQGSLEMLQGLLKDKRKSVYGVFYTNDYFSQRYLCRNHVLADEVNIEDKTVKLKIATRVEHAGLWELENTLDALVHFEAGDIPGYDYTDENATIPTVPEPISVVKSLFSIDLVLIMKEPSITYQSFEIAGAKFLLMNIHLVLKDSEGDFEQQVTLLFGESGKLSLFSHFYDKELEYEDIRTLLHLIMDKNITGKAILGVQSISKSGAMCSLSPDNEQISSWVTAEDQYTFGSGLSFISIPYMTLKTYKLKLNSSIMMGYHLELTNDEHKLEIFMEN